jgi:hypothetical protein
MLFIVLGKQCQGDPARVVASGPGSMRPGGVAAQIARGAPGLKSRPSGNDTFREFSQSAAAAVRPRRWTRSGFA